LLWKKTAGKKIPIRILFRVASNKGGGVRSCGTTDAHQRRRPSKKKPICGDPLTSVGLRRKRATLRAERKGLPQERTITIQVWVTHLAPQEKRSIGDKKKRTKIAKKKSSVGKAGRREGNEPLDGFF